MGRIGQAIEQTTRSYPGLLESNQNLMFMLKCRQFVEMVNGSDMDVSTREIFLLIFLKISLSIRVGIEFTDDICTDICDPIDQALPTVTDGSSRP
jgi:CTLH/CRA C-terminal to LisH motif domain